MLPICVKEVKGTSNTKLISFCEPSKVFIEARGANEIEHEGAKLLCLLAVLLQGCDQCFGSLVRATQTASLDIGEAFRYGTLPFGVGPRAG